MSTISTHLRNFKEPTRDQLTQLYFALPSSVNGAPSASGSAIGAGKNEKGEKKRTATEGLMWLLRGLAFTCKALQIAQADASAELSAAFTQGYEATLKKFHNFVVKGIFAVSEPVHPPSPFQSAIV